MATCFVVLGLSGAGKTEVINHLTEKFRVQQYTPFRFTKAFLEDLYQLPEGALELPQYKAMIPPGAAKPLGEIMVDMFHFWASRDPLYTTRKLRRALRETLGQGRDVVIAGVRNQAECQAIYEFCIRDFHRLVVLNLVRPDNEGLSSDKDYEEIYLDFFRFADYFETYENAGTLEQLRDKASMFYLQGKYPAFGQLVA